MEFENIVGEELDFYGVDLNQFKLGNIIYEAIEDEHDGYRSYLESVIITNSNGIFFPQPLAKVKVEKVFDLDDFYDFEGYVLKDIEDGHIWLAFGTENTNDYYPYFIFKYTIKEEQNGE